MTQPPEAGDLRAVAWLYERPNYTYPDLPNHQIIAHERWPDGDPDRAKWSETPLYKAFSPAPSQGDVELREALAETRHLAECLEEISTMLMARPDMVRAMQPLIGWAEKAVMARAAGALQGYRARAALSDDDGKEG